MESATPRSRRTTPSRRGGLAPPWRLEAGAWCVVRPRPPPILWAIICRSVSMTCYTDLYAGRNVEPVGLRRPWDGRPRCPLWLRDQANCRALDSVLLDHLAGAGLPEPG